MRTKNIYLYIQILFWTLLYVFQVSMVSNFLYFKGAVLVVTTNIALGMLVYYGNALYIFPRFFNKDNYLKYVLFCTLLILSTSVLVYYFDELISARFRISEPRFHIHRFFHFFKAISGLAFIFVISMILSLIRKVFDQEQKEMELTEEKLNTEIRLLKAQISPHFIFNALNNIYSLSYSKSEQSPDAVLKLSQMLRYVFYECNKDEVSLASEIQYIENFIGFQQMKTATRQNITFDTEALDETFRVAPMLLIPFVENSFKYSKIEDDKNISINISVSTGETEMTFKIRNDYPDIRPEAGSGMGIKNVKNRLELTYPGRHEIHISDKDNEFSVELKIWK